MMSARGPPSLPLTAEKLAQTQRQESKKQEFIQKVIDAKPPIGEGEDDNRS